jgi:hypothetical protein
MAKGRAALFGAAMTAVQRKRRQRDIKRCGAEHAAQLERTGAAAYDFANALSIVSQTYARLSKEHGGDKGFAAWLKENKGIQLGTTDRRALVALGRLAADVVLNMPEAEDSPLAVATILHWAQTQRKRMKAS